MDIILKQYKNRALIARVDDNKAYEYIIGMYPQMENNRLIWYGGDYFDDDLTAALEYFDNWIDAYKVMESWEHHA